jgi:hypothetical protein
MGLSPAPFATTFPQAPLRSRTAGFPRSGSDLGFPSWAFPESRRSSSTDIRTPRLRWFTHELVPSFPAALPRLSVQGPPWDRQAPRAPLLHVGVTAHGEGVARLLEGRYPSSSLLRTHAPNRCPPAAFDIVSCGQVFAGCCQPLLRSGPSRRYLCRSLLACLDLYSGGSQGARARYFPQDNGLPLLGTGSARSRCSRQLLLSGEKSRSCSHSPTFRPTSLLATQVAPTLAPCNAGQPWLLRPRLSRFVASPCSGYAYRPNPGN